MQSMRELQQGYHLMWLELFKADATLRSFGCCWLLSPGLGQWEPPSKRWCQKDTSDSADSRLLGSTPQRSCRRHELRGESVRRSMLRLLRIGGSPSCRLPGALV